VLTRKAGGSDGCAQGWLLWAKQMMAAAGAFSEDSMRGLRVSWSSSAWMVARSLCVMCVCDGMKALVALARTGDASRSRNVLLFWFTCSAGLMRQSSECDASARVVTLSAFAAAFADTRKCGAK
jgi:hypothetical protein